MVGTLVEYFAIGKRRDNIAVVLALFILLCVPHFSYFCSSV